MKLYNTRTRKTTYFEPLDAAEITMYSCGPTVYDNVHIGNLQAFIVADTLRRILIADGNKVRHAMNFTDVDDKTIRRSRELYPDDAPEDALKKLTGTYEQIFLADMEAIGNDIDRMMFVRATDHIQDMQARIFMLHETGFAYVTDDGVYFSIEKYRASGKTYGQLLQLAEGNTSEARIDNDEYDKESVHDFALWKAHKENEPAWELSLDGFTILGRPGWHIECSAMSSDTVGRPFDIHTGGVDLIFPHHENEIAQSTADSDNPLYAKYFVHNEHLLVDGKKMSKSLGNFLTLRDIQERGFEPLAFRLLTLQSHYRKQSNFTWENLEAAQNRLQDLRAWADLRYQPSTDEMPEELDLLFRDTRQAIQEALDDDLNTSAALTSLNGLMDWMQQHPVPAVEGKYTSGMLQFLDDVFGLNLANRGDINQRQKQLIAERQIARETKDWAQSDIMRDQLIVQGIGIRDTAYGQTWFRL